MLLSWYITDELWYAVYGILFAATLLLPVIAAHCSVAMVDMPPINVIADTLLHGDVYKKGSRGKIITNEMLSSTSQVVASVLSLFLVHVFMVSVLVMVVHVISSQMASGTARLPHISTQNPFLLHLTIIMLMTNYPKSSFLALN
jgi:hypothetical protein